MQIRNTLRFGDSDGGDNHLVAPEDETEHSWRRQVVRIEKNKSTVRNKRLRSDGRKVEKLQQEDAETARCRIARIEEENGGVPPGLTTGLGHVRHSLPFIGVEQRWWSTVMRGARTLRPQNLVTACAYPQISLPCGCRPMLLLDCFQNHR